MELTVVAVVLCAAALHATWNALVKSDGDPWVALALTNAAIAVLAAPLLLLVPFPELAVWPWLLASTAVHQGYNTMLAASYQYGELSRVYPIARGAAPPLVAIAGLVFAREPLSALGWLAIAAIACGLLSLGHRGQDKRALVCALGTSVFIAAYTLLDGLGVRATGSELGYIVWLFALDALPFGLFVGLRKRHAMVTAIRMRWRRALLGGACAGLAYGAVIWAMARAPLAPVSALRETSVILAAAIGTLLLGESFGRRRIAGAVLVSAGVALLIFQVAP